jgi:UDP-N-acetylglucosamine 1-carboxyvinyltransferase
VADGASRIRETVFESRFGYVDELRRMGADIRAEGDFALINGVPYLTGAPVEAVDIRGGAAVLIGALAARGVTEIATLANLDRGYEQVEEKLSALGADIRRVDVRGGETLTTPVA